MKSYQRIAQLTDAMCVPKDLFLCVFLSIINLQNLEFLSKDRAVAKLD